MRKLALHVSGNQRSRPVIASGTVTMNGINYTPEPTTNGLLSSTKTTHVTVETP